MPKKIILVFILVLLNSFIFSNEAESIFKEALHFHQKGMYDMALTRYNNALKLEPKNQVLLWNRALILIAMKDYDKAEDDLTYLLDLEPENPVYFYQRGKIFLLSEQYEKALEDFNNWLDLEPSEAKAYYFIALTYYKMGEYQKALNFFFTAKNKGDNSIFLNYYLGNAYFFTEKYSFALKYYDIALKLDANYYPAVLNKAVAALYLGYYRLATETLKRAEELNAKDPLIDYNYACYYAKINKDKEALEYLSKAIQKGFKNFTYLKEDKCFNKLSKTKEFNELMKDKK